MKTQQNSYKYPEIKIPDADLLWLNALYSKFKNRESVSRRILKIELADRIPSDFNPYEIDRRLLRHDTGLTLLGMLHIDPDTEFLKITDSVILAIKGLLFENPELREVTAEEIVTKVNIKKENVAIALRLISELGRFASMLVGDSERGLSKIGLEGDDVFDEYLRYSGIEKLIHEFYQRESQKQRSSGSFPSLLRKASNREDKPHPIFRTVIDHVDHKLCFVLMPFAESWSDRVYKELIRENVEKLGFQCIRADNLNGPIIIEDIWTKINQSASL